MVSLIQKQEPIVVLFKERGFVIFGDGRGRILVAAIDFFNEMLAGLRPGTLQWIDARREGAGAVPTRILVKYDSSLLVDRGLKILKVKGLEFWITASFSSTEHLWILWAARTRLTGEDT